MDNRRQAPISRIIEAIYWAIDKDVNIINMSFGTQVYSEALETAIDVATDNGILVIASTGNYGNGSIDYPAAFENVLAVGSTNAAGKVSAFSSTNNAVDLVAPGESVLAQSNFGEGIILSGTSLSASHVTGIAACLWSRDLTKPASFIKLLLKLSAREMTDVGSGCGLVDYEHAIRIYDEVVAQFDAILYESIIPTIRQNLSRADIPNQVIPFDKRIYFNDDTLLFNMDVNNRKFEGQIIQQFHIANNTDEIENFVSGKPLVLLN